MKTTAPKSKLAQTYQPQIHHGDCREVLTQLPAQSIDLIFTSPPYSDRRKSSYGGIKPQNYVDWFLPIAKELKRVLKPTGTFMLNIKEKAMNGQRHPYVLELILALKEQGWLWTEEYIWHKKNPFPGKWRNRFRDAWERLLQFNKQKQFAMYQEAVMMPVSPSTQARMQRLRKQDHKVKISQSGSGFRVRTSNWKDRKLVYPTNVLHLGTTAHNKEHSATFPDALPEWFIKLFTKENDTILDPFMGSGTTNFVAQQLKRQSIGIEILPKYFELVKAKIN
ncbi:MAG: site-specific DNA-methyltransferase [Bacteroidota bacterium]